MKNYIGIDLGGTNIVAAVFNEKFKLLAKLSCKTNLPRSAEMVAIDMANLSNRVLKKARLGWSVVEGVGIGAPGVVDSREKIIKYSCNFNYFDEPLALILQNKLKKQVHIENDANAAALGEFYFRKKVDFCLNSMVLLTLGTGVGGGIVFNGRIYNGFNFCGAEIGHMVIKKRGRRCNCGRQGCFETYASATGLIRTAMEFMKANRQSKLWHIFKKTRKLSGRYIFDAACQGDSTAIKIKERFISDLGEGVVNIINIFQPQLVCIGGGVSQQGRALLEPLRRFVQKFDYARSLDRRCRLEICKLKMTLGYWALRCFVKLKLNFKFAVLTHS